MTSVIPNFQPPVQARALFCTDIFVAKFNCERRGGIPQAALLPKLEEYTRATGTARFRFKLNLHERWNNVGLQYRWIDG